MSYLYRITFGIYFCISTFTEAGMISIAKSCEQGFFSSSVPFTTLNYKMNTLGQKTHTDQVINHLKKLYDPIFLKTKNHLNIEILWKESKVNAYATKDDFNNPTIRLTGGMANHELITPDGLALILCHEIGHFLGGEPKKLRGRSKKRSWSSAEGQADYYANAVCLKKLFQVLPKDTHSLNTNASTNSRSALFDKEMDNINSLQSTYRHEIQEICESSICDRIALASINVAKLYASTSFYSGRLSLITHDASTVYQTIYSHPNPQCRLDTFIAALKCENSEKLLFKTNDVTSGACENPEFRRPRCWYYPEF